jgi:spore coat protein CotH
MRILWLRRIVLFALLFAAIGGLAWYGAVTSADGYETIVRLANNRKQKNDYERLFDDSLFKTITVVFEQESFDALLSDMKAYFAAYGTYRDNTMHKVDVIYDDGDGTTFTLHEVGFRTKSNTSRNLPLTYDWRGREVWHQTSFQLQFDATFDYGVNSNEYSVLKKREAFNLDQLNFEYCKVVAGELDEAMISEAFAYELFADAGLPVSNSSYALVYLQIGETVIPYGFYTVLEPIDRNFLSKNFDEDIAEEYGDLYKCTDTDGIADLGSDYLVKTGINDTAANIRYSYALKNNTNGGLRTSHDALATLVGVVNGDDFASRIEDVLDVDLFLRYLAMGFLVGNTDDFRYNFNNYYLYFAIYGGVATMIPFDLDSSLGVGKHQDETGNHGVYYDLFPASDAANPLVANVLAIAAYRERYVAYLEEFVAESFDFTVFREEFETARDLYESILVAENHLGNQVFDLRNAEWYFTEKASQVTTKVAAWREMQG